MVHGRATHLGRVPDIHNQVTPSDASGGDRHGPKTHAHARGHSGAHSRVTNQCLLLTIAVPLHRVLHEQ